MAGAVSGILVRMRLCIQFRINESESGWSPCRRGVARSLYVICDTVTSAWRFLYMQQQSILFFHRVRDSGCDAVGIMDVSFPCTFVPGKETITMWSFRSRERKCMGKKRPGRAYHAIRHITNTATQRFVSSRNAPERRSCSFFDHRNAVPVLFGI